MERFDFVVVGAGPAGGSAAMALAQGAAGTVALIGNEVHPPYERPPLSKAVLMEQGRPANFMLGDAQALRSAGIAAFLGEEVASIDRAARAVVLVSGRRIGYGTLILAMGASARRLTLPGAELPGVRVLRTLDDANALSRELRTGRAIAVIGGGFIGLEVAAAARRLGCDVTVLEAGARLLGRVVPEVVAASVLRKYRAEGVVVRLGQSVIALRGEARVRGLELAGGEVLAVDTVVVGVGSVPNDEIARRAGLSVSNGIDVDGSGRTSDPHCYAIGDVAHQDQRLRTHPGYVRRLEAWEPAIEQGLELAGHLKGTAQPARRSPWVWSDLFDWNLQIAGHGELADTDVVRPGRTPDAFTVFQLSQGRLVGLVTLNDGRNMLPGRRALQTGAVLDPLALAAPDISLKNALAGSHGASLSTHST
ncbi:NAD(P)/FAD-dependent oxidoreductase [Variovorax boronicumulans]|uniref:NAD(P)/FAD-dependent oxidoreductase n=1 Tax=Variovorax boronicumulans TaxID=436515 RepID=UPI00155326BB|nr:FAD-dependent oxidoreductase [Variovorax boronicumulans]